MNISGGRRIVISEMKLNNACTVAHVWWTTMDILNEKQKDELKDIQIRLMRARNYLAGQLVHILGLRYAPDIRFYMDKSDEAYEEFLETVTEKVEGDGMEKKLLAEIQKLKAWTPSEIDQIKQYLKDDEERKKFEKVMTRENLLKEEQQIEETDQANKMMQQLTNSMPKLKERKQKKLEEYKKKHDLALEKSGYDAKTMEPNADNVDDVLDRYIISYTSKIPKKEKNFDSSGKKIRKHPRDENGKKIKSPKKNRAAKFWNSLPNA